MITFGQLIARPLSIRSFGMPLVLISGLIIFLFLAILLTLLFWMKENKIVHLCGIKIRYLFINIVAKLWMSILKTIFKIDILKIRINCLKVEIISKLVLSEIFNFFPTTIWTLKKKTSCQIFFHQSYFTF